MPRPASGGVRERHTRHGVSYALRFSAYGQRQHMTLGTDADGWTRARAEDELAYVLAQVERGEWRPPEPAPVVDMAPDPTFHAFASEWFDARRRELRPNTQADYGWRLTNHLLPFFARHRLQEITVAEVDRYRQAKVREGELSAESINKTLVLLAQVLDVAVEYGLIDRNPAVGRRRRLRVRRPARSYMDTAEQITALLDAAGELDNEARADRQHVARRTSIAVLVFAGLRLGELLALRWRDVDLGSRRLLVRDAKTAAGVRHVTIRPGLLGVLTVYSEHTEIDPDALAFASDTGGRFGPSNYRRRVLTKAVERADKRLKKADRAPLPEGLTPQSLRRTFASLLYAIGESPPVVMAEIGHTDPKLALSVYAQAMRRGDDERAALEALMAGGFVDSKWTSEPETPAEAGADDPADDENPADSGASDDGRGWFRTSDLSRVKRALSH